MQGDDWDNGSMKRFGLPMDDRTGDGTFASGLLHRRGGVHPAGGPGRLWLRHALPTRTYRKETNAQHSHFGDTYRPVAATVPTGARQSLILGVRPSATRRE